MKILVTAFDPFGGESINPALKVIQQLPSQIKGAAITRLEVPTVFRKSAQILEAAVRDRQPDVVLCIGQAGGRAGLTPERIAINQDDARIPDNEGQQPIDVPIQEKGQSAYFSTLPIKAMVEAIQAIGLPASVSNTAGTFVCNHLFYQTLYLADTAFPEMKVGFLHIPYLPEQVVNKPHHPSMNAGDMVKGIVAAIEAIIDYDGKADQKTTGGALH